MITPDRTLEKFESDFISGRLGVGKLSRRAALKIFEAMWREAVALGVLPSQNPLEGIEVDIRIAKTLNSCSRKSKRFRL